MEILTLCKHQKLPESFNSLTSFLVCFLLLWETPWPNASWGGKGLFYWALPGHIQSLRKVRAGSWSRNMEENCSLWLAQPTLIQPGPACLPQAACPGMALPTRPGDGSSHSGLGLPFSINNQENAPQKCPQASLIVVILQLRFLFQETIDYDNKN